MIDKTNKTTKKQTKQIKKTLKPREGGSVVIEPKAKPPAHTLEDKTHAG